MSYARYAHVRNFLRAGMARITHMECNILVAEIAFALAVCAVLCWLAGGGGAQCTGTVYCISGILQRFKQLSQGEAAAAVPDASGRMLMQQLIG